MLGSFTRFKTEYLPRLCRLAVNVLLCLPLIALSVLMSRFEPIYRKLDEKGELSLPLAHIRTAVGYDNRLYHLLLLSTILYLSVLDELALLTLRSFGRDPDWRWVWYTTKFAGMVGISFVMLLSMLLQVAKMSSGAE